MRKTLAVMVMVGLIAGAFAVPAEAKKKKKPKRIERTAKGAYDAPTLILVGTCAQSGAIGCVSFPTAANEGFVSAAVTDQHGQPVYVSVSADTNGDNQDDESYGSFCGETAEPIAVPSGTELHFWVGFSPDPGLVGCVPGFATSGTITATFSNLP